MNGADQQHESMWGFVAACGGRRGHCIAGLPNVRPRAGGALRMLILLWPFPVAPALPCT